MLNFRPLSCMSLQKVLQKNTLKSFDKRFISQTQRLSTEKDSEPDPKHPIRRTLNILKNDLKRMRDYFRVEPNRGRDETDDDIPREKFDPQQPSQFQAHCDVLIIGAGGVGCSISYWLKEKARNGLNVVVVDKDLTYRKSFAVRSFHGLHQNFLVPENVQMSLYGADFIRSIKDHLGDVDLNFTPYGSLRLASEEDAETLRKSSKLQNELGIRNELLSSEKLKQKFPWLNTEGIVLGCHGLEREGWFDPLALLFGLKYKASEYGAHFIDGEVVDFEYQTQSNVIIDGETSGFESLDKAVVQMPDGEKRTIKFAICIIAAGSSSGHIGRLARIGNSGGLLSIPITIEPRNRNKYIFSTTSKQTPAFSTPLTVDPAGFYFTREGLSGNYLCGQNLAMSSEKVIDSPETGVDVFNTEILPNLSKRVEGFGDAKVTKSWTESYEYNSFDENGIIGPHPYYNNLYIAAGCNRHGIQQAPAIGRGISELIVDGRFRTIDLTRFGFDRLVVNQPLYEFSTI